MAIAYGTIGGVLFAGAIALYVSEHPLLALILALICAYFWVETFRWAYWRDVDYDESEGKFQKSPPENLIKKLFRKLLK